MKAIRIHNYGGVEVLRHEDIPVPKPQRGEVLIQAHAAGVNPIDAKIREGKTLAVKFRKPFPHILGWDVSGVVVGLGPGVGKYKINDAVYGMIRFPEEGASYAEYVTAPATDIALKPGAVDFIQAAALPLAALTGWQALFETADLSEGESILIHGASGGVGHLAVQFAKWRGAYVVGTASSHNESFLRDIGVDEYINYESIRFDDVLKGIDVALDCVGGEAQERTWKILKKGGFLVTIRNSPSPERMKEYGVRASRILVHTSGENLTQITKLVELGFIQPHIQTVLPLEEVHKAHELIETQHTRGKIVLKIID